MTLSRVSTKGITQMLMKDMQINQNRYADLAESISSGKKAQTFQGMKLGESEFLLQVESKLKRYDRYTENIVDVRSRLQTMDKALELMIEAADKLQDTIIIGLTPQLPSTPVQAIAESTVQIVASQLNSNINGRYVFSGGRTDAQTVNLDELSPAVRGEPDARYYQGDETVLKARIEDTYVIEYGLTGDNQAFQKLFAAADQAAYGGSVNSQAELREALVLVNESVDELIRLRSKVNSDLVQLEYVDEVSTKIKVYWKELSESLISTDVVQASAELSQNEVILQATYQAFVRMTRLTLTDFL